MKRLLLLPVLLTACTDLDILPEGARVTCIADDECPTDFVCRANLGRCVPAADLDKPAIAFDVEPALDRARVSHVETFSAATLTATLSEAPAQPATVSVDGEVIPCGDAAELSCALDAAELDLDEGVHAVALRAVDRAGNELTAELALEVDLTAPGLVGDPVVRLAPLEGNPLAQPSALGLLSAASIDVVVDELQAEQPTLHLLGDPLVTATAAGDLAADIAFTFAVNVAEGDAEGPRELQLELVDSVGNRATLDTGAFVDVDLTDPAAADVQTAGAVVLERAPWGTLDTAGAPRFVVTGAAGALEPDALVVARLGPDADDLVLGQGFAGAAGELDLELIPLDAARVFLTVIDAAGNQSPVAQGRDVRWTASLGGKVRGSRVENPHALFEARLFDERGLLLDQLDEPVGVSALSDFSGALTSESVIRFDELRFVDPGSRGIGQGGIAYHAGRGAVMVFGGVEGSAENNPSNRLFEIVGDTWRLVASNRSPPVGRASMVYDWRRDRLVATVLEETWAFEDGDWRQLEDLPVSRLEGLAYDRARDRVIMTDGARTFVFDGASWTEDTGAQPGGRRAFGITYDPAAGDVLLYGGRLFAGSVSDELWRYGDGGWTLAGTAEATTGVVLTEDPVLGRVLAVGGTCTADLCVGAASEVRTLDGNTFTTVADLGLGGLIAQLAVWDARQDRVIWIGGTGELAIPGFFENHYRAMNADLSVEDLRVLPTPLGARGRAHAFFDPLANELLFLGGEQAASDFIVPLFNAVAFDGVGGRLAGDLQGDPNAARPFFDGAAVRYHDSFAGMVRRSGDTWVTEATPAGFAEGAALAFHPTVGEAVGFGSSSVSDATFLFNGAAVTPLDPTNKPPARSRTQAVYDARRDAVLIFGGRDAGFQTLLDTWAFDGADWQLLDSDGPATSGLVLVYDDARGRTLLVKDGELHELTAGGWVLVDVERPELRNSMATGFDAASGLLVAHGGSVAFETTDAFFAWDGDPEGRPAQILEVDLRARAAAPASVISALEVRADVGARGFTDDVGGPVANAGVDLLGWGELWTPLQSAAALDVDDPQALAVDVDDPDLVRGLAGDLVRFALTPSAGQGPRGPDAEGARITTRRFEVTVVYRE
jgi:hypothetical protein